MPQHNAKSLPFQFYGGTLNRVCVWDWKLNTHNLLNIFVDVCEILTFDFAKLNDSKLRLENKTLTLY